MVAEIAPKYQAMMQEEIHLMTAIDDPAHSIKNAVVCKEKERELRKKMFCNFSFNSIAKDVLEFTLQKCEGNPLISMQFLFNLIAVSLKNDQYVFRMDFLTRKRLACFQMKLSRNVSRKMIGLQYQCQA